MKIDAYGWHGKKTALPRSDVPQHASHHVSPHQHSRDSEIESCWDTVILSRSRNLGRRSNLPCLFETQKGSQSSTIHI